MALGALKFKTTAVGRQPNELGRLRVLGGPDAGALFVITLPRVSIGRGEENEVMVMDLKMSRRHAEMLQTPQGMLIRDLGSSNGVAINGQPMKQWFLKSGDKIGMGQSVFEYMGMEAGTQMMQMPAQAAPQVGGGIASGLTQFIRMPPPGAGAPTSQSLFDKNKRLWLIIAVLLGAAYLAPQAEIQVKKRRKAYEPPAEIAGNNLKQFLPQAGETDVKHKADAYFKEGYREFKERNYIRAKTNFEVALQVMPGHEMARVYRENVVKAMEVEAKDLKALARRDEEANRLRAALEKYDSIRRLYFKDQANPMFLEADKAYKDLEKKVEAP